MTRDVNENDIKLYLEQIPNNGLENKSDAEKNDAYNKISKVINIARADRNITNLIDVMEELRNSGISKDLHEAIINNFIPEQERKPEQVNNNMKNSKKEMALIQKEIDKLYLEEYGSSNKTIEQIGEISSKILEIYLETLNHKFIHDTVTGVIALSAEAISVSSLLATKASLKVGKTVLKFSGKAVAGVYKASKGLAQKAAKKVEDRKNQKAMKKVKEVKDISGKIKEGLEQRVLDITLPENDILDVDKREEMIKIRDGSAENVEDFEDKLLFENIDLKGDIKVNLYEIEDSKIKEQLRTKLNMQPDEIKELLNKSSIDENDEIVLPGGTKITLNDIDKAGLTQKFKDTIKIISELESQLNDYRLNNLLLDEIGARRELSMAQNLDNQMEFISNKMNEINNKENRSFFDKRKRNDLTKIAEQKVKNLENAGIVETIEAGKRKNKKVIIDAENMLLGLDKAKSVKERKLEKLEEKEQDQTI